MKTSQLLIVNKCGYLGTHDDNEPEIEPLMPVGLDGTVPENKKYQHSFNRQEADDTVQPLLPAGMGVRGNGLDNI